MLHPESRIRPSRWQAGWLVITLACFGGTVWAQVEENPVRTLPTGSQVLDVVHGVDGHDWMLHVEPGAAVTSLSVRLGGGPGSFVFLAALPGTTGAFSRAGDTLVVGDPGGTVIPGTPSVTTYRNLGGAWAPMPLTATLTHPSNPSLATEWGAVVRISTDVLVVGSPGVDQVHAYRDRGPTLGDWHQELGFQGQPGSETGSALDLADDGSSEWMLIGAPEHDGGVPGGGPPVGMSLFWRSEPHNAVWVPTGFGVTFGEPGSRFGASVALRGDLALVGCPGFDDGGTDRGAVAVFEKNVNWDFMTFFTGQRDGDGLGTTVAVIDERLLAAAPGYDGTTADGSDPFVVSDRGAARVLRTSFSFGNYTVTDGPHVYTLADVGGNGIPSSAGNLGGYDGYDHLLWSVVDDGTAAYVLESRSDPESWQWSHLGQASAGTFGDPELTGEGTWGDGDLLRVGLFDTLPGTLSYLVVGLAAVNLPFYGGTLVPDFQAPLGTFIPVPTAPLGGWVLQAPLPPGLPGGLDLFLQAWIVDPGGIGGFAGSNALKATTP